MPLGCKFSTKSIVTGFNGIDKYDHVLWNEITQLRVIKHIGYSVISVIGVETLLV